METDRSKHKLSLIVMGKLNGSSSMLYAFLYEMTISFQVPTSTRGGAQQKEEVRHHAVDFHSFAIHHNKDVEKLPQPVDLITSTSRLRNTSNTRPRNHVEDFCTHELS